VRVVACGDLRAQRPRRTGMSSKGFIELLSCMAVLQHGPDARGCSAALEPRRLRAGGMLPGCVAARACNGRRLLLRARCTRQARRGRARGRAGSAPG